MVIDEDLVMPSEWRSVGSAGSASSASARSSSSPAFGSQPQSSFGRPYPDPDADFPSLPPGPPPPLVRFGGTNNTGAAHPNLDLRQAPTNILSDIRHIGAPLGWGGPTPSPVFI